MNAARFITSAWFPIIAAFFAACSSESASTRDSGAPASSQFNSDGTTTTLSFTLHLDVDADDDAYDFQVDLSDAHEMELTLSDDGALAVPARDVPRLIYRICTTGSPRTGCRNFTDALTADVDLVFDACGRFTPDSQCGDSDGTIITGRIEESGKMTLDHVPVRARVFAADSETNGATASDMEPGLVDVDRILVTLTTEAQGGARIRDTDVTLIGTGTIPAGTEAVGGARFVGSITGEFSHPPLEAFE